MDATRDTYRETFFPNFDQARRRAIESGGRFAYYTSAATACLILKHKEIWMRNTAVMNDYLEVAHGLNCLVQAYRSDAGGELQAALNECFQGITTELNELFNSWIPIIQKHTYIISMSEHPALEDAFGRLSMWRAYGGDAGVALILNGGAIFRPSDALRAYSAPVAYHSSEGVAHELKTIAHGIRQNIDYVRSLGREGVKGAMFEVLRYAAICTKHPAFIEEREWRVVSTQILHRSERLKPAPEVIGSVPQLVLKVKLEDVRDQGLYGLTIPDFVDKILIGPCEHPETIKSALSSLLADCGVPNADERVHITGVPLRPNQR